MINSAKYRTIGTFPIPSADSALTAAITALLIAPSAAAVVTCISRSLLVDLCQSGQVQKVARGASQYGPRAELSPSIGWLLLLLLWLMMLMLLLQCAWWVVQVCRPRG
jgi:hypothetical protein